MDIPGLRDLPPPYNYTFQLRQSIDDFLLTTDHIFFMHIPVIIQKFPIDTKHSHMNFQCSIIRDN